MAVDPSWIAQRAQPGSNRHFRAWLRICGLSSTLFKAEWSLGRSPVHDGDEKHQRQYCSIWRVSIVYMKCEQNRRKSIRSVAIGAVVKLSRRNRRRAYVLLGSVHRPRRWRGELTTLLHSTTSCGAVPEAGSHIHELSLATTALPAGVQRYLHLSRERTYGTLGRRQSRAAHAWEKYISAEKCIRTHDEAEQRAS